MPPVHSREVQQTFYDNLANRDYDCFQASDERYLKLKIAYTKFGTPQDPDVRNDVSNEFTVAQLYNKEQNATIKKILTAIKSKSADPDAIIISFLFNCCEPIQLQKPKKNKLTKTKNDHTEEQKSKVDCFPVYRVKKCMGSPTGDDCCVFIDDHSRVYATWTDYLQNNKIPKARMCVPKDGKYKANEKNEVLLTELVSPACYLSEDLKRGADTTTTAASLISGGIVIGAMVPSITVAPVVLAGALVTAAGAGIYSMIRSTAALHDRKVHCQTISVRNAEARNCYLNIVTGAMSVFTTGATKAATVALNRGVILSETAATALLGVNVVNMTVNGCNAVNSMVSIVDDIMHKKSPSALDIMHMTTTVLFFGNAVVNFKSAHTIYKQTHGRSLGNMLQTQKEGLLQKAKRMFFDADVTSSDVNASVREVSDSEDFYLNVIGPVLPAGQDVHAWKQTAEMSVNALLDWMPTFQFGYLLIKNRHNVWAVVHMILSRFELSIQQKLVSLTKWLIGSVIKDAHKELIRIFPNSEILVVLMNFVINYLRLQVNRLEIDYQQKRTVAIAELKVTEEKYEREYSGFSTQWERMGYFFQICVLRMFCSGGNIEEIICREMVRFFWDWLADQAAKFMRQRQRKAIESYRMKVHCPVCRGYYFEQ